LNRDPNTRLGVHSKDEIKKHPFFKDINWSQLLKKKIKPPIDLVEVKNEIDNNINKVKTIIFLKIISIK
jgi:hypothetical protein